MAELLIGLLTLGVCVCVLGAYVAVVEHYLGR